MKRITRRHFVKQSGAVGLATTSGVTFLANPLSARGTPSNDRIQLGIIGCGGRGTQLACDFEKRNDCTVTWLADPSTQRLQQCRQALDSLSKSSQIEQCQDFRRMLDDRSLDAVVVATPDHWHALATIWSCQAGKDVYVEKPVSHNCWEGRKMVEAARKYGRVVQSGFQNRSAPYAKAAVDYVQEGKLGDIHFCRILNQKPPWGNCPVMPDGDTPEGLDWDIWNGPASSRRYNASLHECWHHQWDYSGGDIANDASHQIDLARWVLGVSYPNTVYSTGGRFDVKSAAQTPDTQVALFDFNNLLVSFELTLFTPYMLKEDPEVRNNDIFPYWMQNSTRIEIFGSKAMMLLCRHGGGWQVFTRPHNRQPVVQAEIHGRFPDTDHKENFASCIRSRCLPNADIEQAHLSCLLIHYANISYHLGGEKLRIDPHNESILNNAAASAMQRRNYRAPFELSDIV